MGSLGLSLLCQPLQGSQGSTDVFLPLWGKEDCIYCISGFEWWLWLQHLSIETFWAVQSTSRLWCDSQGCPMITDCHPRLVSAICAISKCHLNCWRVRNYLLMEPV